jgi:4-alpha-glucanotransferase
MYGLIQSCFVWMSNPGPPRSLAFLLTISALLVKLWGNPLYRWDVSVVSGHRWWIDRFRASLKLFALLRLDHFRGFEAFWEVPATAATGQAGKWVKGPGAEFFRMG